MHDDELCGHRSGGKRIGRRRGADGRWDEQPIRVLYLPPLPTITEIRPSNGPPAGGTLVTITGTSLTPAPQVRPIVNFGAIQVLDANCSSNTVCTVVAPPGSGTVEVTVQTISGTSNAVSFRYNLGLGETAPTSSTVAPSSTAPSSGTGTGTGTASGAGALPATGTASPTLIAMAAALLGLGVVAVLISRRRTA